MVKGQEAEGKWPEAMCLGSTRCRTPVLGSCCRLPPAFCLLFSAVGLLAAEPQPTYTYEAENYTWGSNSVVVEDPQASGGRAVHAVPGVSSPGYVMAVQRAPEIIPGEYRALFRLKVKENASNTPIGRIDTRAAGHGDPVWPDYEIYKFRDLKAEDFPKAGEYVEMEMPLLRLDKLYALAVVGWAGKAELWVDKLALTAAKLYTDDELIAMDKSFKAPESLPAVESEGNLVLVVRGLYHRLYGVERAARSLAGVTVATCDAAFTADGWALKPAFPRTYSELFRYRAVVLLDVDAHCIEATQRRMLKDFVEAGGSLLVAGGPYSLGKGRYHRTYLADLLPTTLDAPWSLAVEPAPVPLYPGQGPLADALPGAPQPMVMCYHHVSPKPGAQVWLFAGKDPAVCVWAHGKGKVVVLTLTPLGASTPGPFFLSPWFSPAPVMGKLITWLVQ